jgi:hypothetical protein
MLIATVSVSSKKDGHPRTGQVNGSRRGITAKHPINYTMQQRNIGHLRPVFKGNLGTAGDGKHPEGREGDAQQVSLCLYPLRYPLAVLNTELQCNIYCLFSISLSFWRANTWG